MYAIFSNTTGLLSSYASDIETLTPKLGQEVYEISVDKGDVFLSLAGEVKPLPKRTSKYDRWDRITETWTDPRSTAEKQAAEWPQIRTKRNQLLLASDWTQLPDVPLATKEAWAVYRQALRDITEQPDPFNITWPAAPST